MPGKFRQYYFFYSRPTSLEIEIRLQDDSCGQFIQVTLAPEPGPERYRLKLVPNRSTVDLKEVFLEIDRKTFDLVEITTVNVYGDETRIELKNIQFDPPPTDTLFRFEVPQGADVLQMNP